MTDLEGMPDFEGYGAKWSRIGQMRWQTVQAAMDLGDELIVGLAAWKATGKPAMEFYRRADNFGLTQPRVSELVKLAKKRTLIEEHKPESMRAALRLTPPKPEPIPAPKPKPELVVDTITEEMAEPTAEEEDEDEYDEEWAIEEAREELPEAFEGLDNFLGSLGWIQATHGVDALREAIARDVREKPELRWLIDSPDVIREWLEFVRETVENAEPLTEEEEAEIALLNAEADKYKAESAALRKKMPWLR